VTDSPQNRLKALITAKIEGATWHTLRHTFASRAVMAGVDIRTGQELMGHSTITMTMRYAHLSPAHLRAAVNKASLGQCQAQNQGQP
jgi:site-specific recombinase XerD